MRGDGAFRSRRRTRTRTRKRTSTSKTRGTMRRCYSSPHVVSVVLFLLVNSISLEFSRTTSSANAFGGFGFHPSSSSSSSSFFHPRYGFRRTTKSSTTTTETETATTSTLAFVTPGRATTTTSTMTTTTMTKKRPIRRGTVELDCHHLLLEDDHHHERNSCSSSPSSSSSRFLPFAATTNGWRGGGGGGGGRSLWRNHPRISYSYSSPGATVLCMSVASKTGGGGGDDDTKNQNDDKDENENDDDDDDDRYDASRIRNFSIIAHIDHGKSTLADRLLETTETVAQRDMEAQLLDNMDIERERGITIKLQAARVKYRSKVDGRVYTLNLIDTPGHVDFSYEVSRSLAACEGALLVVDASQGIEAQTLANVYLALENDLEVIPVLNKIDLPASDPERVKEEIETTIGLECDNAVLASAKTGVGIDDILEAIVRDVPSPPAETGGPFRALIFDSYYDAYRGVVVFFRVVDGSIRRGDRVRFLASRAEHDVNEVGIMQPQQVPVPRLRAGEVGYLCGSIKDVLDARVGDTVVLSEQYKEALSARRQQQQQQQPAGGTSGTAKGSESTTTTTTMPIPPLPGYADSVPMVYCGLFPVDADDYETLRDSLGKLRLNDAALSYEPETSGAMGFGFRCGFLGLLHMEIVQERLQREYNIDLIVTAPSVVYHVVDRRLGTDGTDSDNDDSGDGEGKGNVLVVDAPSKMPDIVRDLSTLEPYVRMEILTPSEYNGAIIELGQERRGTLIDIRFLTPTRSTIVYELPLAEVITDFFDVLKSRTKGYASMEYSVIDYRESDLVRLDVKINYEDAPPLATIVHRDRAQSVGRRLVSSLKDLIPRQMFKVPLQACVGVKVVASESISPIRKDVLAKCYGGDLSRKKKLLQKQARGKKKMKAIGKVNVPQEAFMAVINMNGNNKRKGGGGD